MTVESKNLVMGESKAPASGGPVPGGAAGLRVGALPPRFGGAVRSSALPGPCPSRDAWGRRLAKAPAPVGEGWPARRRLTFRRFDAGREARTAAAQETLTDSIRLDLMGRPAKGPDQGSSEAPTPHRVVEYGFDLAAAYGFWDEDAVEARLSSLRSGVPAAAAPRALAACRAGR